MVGGAALSIHGACSLLVLLLGTFSLWFKGSANLCFVRVVNGVPPGVWVGL